MRIDRLFNENEMIAARGGYYNTVYSSEGQLSCTEIKMVCTLNLTYTLRSTMFITI